MKTHTKNLFLLPALIATPFHHGSCFLRHLAIILFLGASLHSIQASPGANVPWITYEAENMTNSGGTIIGPPAQVIDINAGVANTIEMEASGGQAVELTGTGQYVELTAQTGANAIVVRYCVPDTADGVGTNSTISLYQNGIFVQKLPVTSQYSWRYGANPFTNNPASGSPRNFFDEVRLNGLTINAGDKVRIEKDANDTAAYCVVDLVDLENVAAPLTAPGNSLSVTGYGADTNGVVDSTAALQNCINAATSLGKKVWMPAGTYIITGSINLPSSTTVQGAGMWYTTLLGKASLYNTTPSRRITFDGSGNNIHLSDFAILGRLNYRNDSEANDGLGGSYGIGSTISRVWVEHTKTGAWIINSSGLVIDGCRFRNTIADGCNLAVGMQSTTVTNCTARGTGDDCFAIWPATYTSQTYTPGLNVITHCTGQAPDLANGGAIYGGVSNRIEDCAFLDIPYGCGLLIAGTFPVGANVFSGTTVAQRCDLTRCGGYDPGWQWRAAVTLCPQNINIVGVNLNHLNITNSLSYAFEIVSPGSSSTVGLLSNATMNLVNISTYGVQVPPYQPAPYVDGVYGVWARGDSYGSLNVGGLTVNGAAITSLPASGSDMSNQSSGSPVQNFAFTFIHAGVVNGGFETGDFTGWTLSGNTSWTIVDNGSRSGITPHSGNYLAAMGPAGSLGYISQTLLTIPGTSYLLSFWLDSPDGATPNEALVSWNGNTLADVTNLPAFGWTEFQFVVTATGASAVLQFGFRDDPSNFGLDDISVVAPQITIDTAQTLRVADGRWFGLNSAMWDSYYDTPQTVSLLNELGTRIIRLPGGSLSDQYHWSLNTTLANTWQWATSFANFIHVITNASINSQAIVTVNYGTGSPQEAAAWVAYCNAAVTNSLSLGVDAKGINWQTAGYWALLRAAAPLGTDDGKNFLRISRTAPLGLKYWEIGNECYGTWETDSNAVANDPYTYALRATNYIALMKAVDPTIKIGVVSAPGEDTYVNNTSHPAYNPREGTYHNGWTPVMLATLNSSGVTPDFLVDHFYSEYNSDNDQSLLQASANWASDASSLRQQITDYVGGNGTNIELLATENNADAGNQGKQSTSVVNGLYLADSLAQLMKTEFNSFIWWDLRNGTDTSGDFSASLYGWRTNGDLGVIGNLNTRYPTFYTFKLMQHFVQPGDTVLDVEYPNPLLSAYATRGVSGAVSLLVINKDPSNTITEPITLAGLAPNNTATILSYGIPQDEATRTNGPAAAQDIATNSFTAASTNFTYAFPPYSLTLITLAPARPSLVTQPTAPSGPFVFQLQGQSGVRYVVQSSTNLTQWIAVSTNTYNGSALNFTNPVSPGLSMQFWRAVWQP
jgi:hypothetical protein